MAFPAAPFQIRIPPSGPPIQADNIGDGLLWMGNGWQTAPISSSSVTEFDHLISTRQDLVDVVAPVGGVFLLPSGSYFFKAEIDLDAGERVELDGVDCFFMGGGLGQNRGFNGNAGGSTPALTLINGASLTMLNMLVGAVTPTSHGIDVDSSSITAIQCNIPSSTAGTQPAVLLGTDSEGDFRSCNIGGALPAVQITGGSSKHIFDDCDLNAGLSGIGFEIAAAALELSVTLAHCRLSGSAATTSPAMVIAGTNLDTSVLDCILECPAATIACLRINATDSVLVQGGTLRNTSGGTVGDGIEVNGNITGGLQVLGVHGEALDDFVFRGAGLQNRVVIQGCDTASDVANGVDWSSGNIPTNGILELGNQFNTSSPFQNHNSTDARVNRKCNSLQGGLSTETAIVP